MLSAGTKDPVLPFEFKTDVLNYWQIKIFIEGVHSYLDLDFRSVIVFSFPSMDPKISQKRCKSVKNVVDLPSDVVVRHCLWVTGCLPVVVMAKGDMQHCTVLAFSTNPRFLLVHLIVLSCKSLVAWKSQWWEHYTAFPSNQSKIAIEPSQHLHASWMRLTCKLTDYHIIR